tara:strand:+ start:261 stop:1400 length:1140 start_codon:yes stop_codon:yes gene_type:complete
MQSERLLLISPDYPPPFIGGSLVYINNLIENSDLEFSILTEKGNRTSDKKKKYIESTYMINSLKANNINMFGMYLFIAFYLLFNFRKFDLITLNISAIGNGFFAFFLNLLNKKTTIISFAEELTLAMKSPGVKGCLKRLCLKGYKKASMNISISNFAKDFQINKLDVKTPIHVIPTPVHSEKFYANKENLKKNKEFLSVGRLIERKGHILVLKAFRKILAVDSTLNLTIIGDGPEYPRLIRYIEEKSLSKNVQIYRNVTDDFLRSQYQNHKIFILANLMLKNGDCEGAPNVLIEAAAYGLPSIAGIEGGTSDVVENEKSGYLVDPRDTDNLAKVALKLISDKEKLNEMSKYAIQKATFDHDKYKAGKTFRNHILDCIGN